VAAARSGDRGALDALLRRHHDRLWALCRRLTGNDADAADALQDALIAIVRGLDRFDGRAAFTTWSYRVATNATLDELRRRKRRPRPGLPGDDGGADGGRLGGGSSGGGSPGGGGSWAAAGAPVAAGFAGPVAPGPDVDAAVADRLDVDAALARLPEDFRVAVVLRDLCDLEYAEIAGILGVPPGTVRSRIARGRGLLADLLGNRTPPPDRPTPAS
jgi:RNA polymerase sigma-70 factor (ECF subfamily)